jgi:hypothetical protein
MHTSVSSRPRPQSGRRAGTHTPQLIERARRIGPCFRRDDVGGFININALTVRNSYSDGALSPSCQRLRSQKANETTTTAARPNQVNAYCR